MKIVPPNFRWLCHAELGRANLTVDNLDGAITELKTAARLKPASAQIRFLLAQAYRRAGRAEDARTETAEFQRLKLQQDPFALPALSRLGNR
jgi:Flp pilus assembly protein TadD